MDGVWGVLMTMTMMGVVVAVLAGAVVLALVAVNRPSSTPSGGTASPTGGAEQILAERLARGEIDADEYRSRLDAMRARPRGA